MAPATKTEKVVFAEDTATVHILNGDVEYDADGNIINEPVTGRVLIPGEYVKMSEVPSYLRKLVEEGKAPNLILLTPTQAQRLVKQAERAKASIADLVDDEEE